tara:strand:- start:545 stop:763 length:219 start_codon:yes stop_codon:yes gene_type:complete
MTELNPRWASREQAAEHVGVSVFTIDRWRIKGLITARRAGGVVRFDLNEIDAVLLGQTAVPSPAAAGEGTAV